MGQALHVIAALFDRTPETLDWSQLRYQHTQAIRTKLAESRSPAGTNKMLAALRGVLKEAWRLGLMTAEDYHRATDLPGVRGERLPRGRALSGRELHKLFTACANDASAIGRRDAALLAVMYAGGLRRSEVVGLDLGDYVANTGELRVRDGKGRKERLAYATDGARLALDAWLAVRGDEAGPLFWPADGRGRALVNRRMTDQAVLLLLRRRADQGRWHRSLRTTSGARSSATCSTRARTWSPCRSWQGTRMCRQPPSTTGVTRKRGGERRNCSGCRL